MAMHKAELRRIRKKLKLTQAEFAEALGYTVSGYQQLEYGTNRITRPTENLIRLTAEKIENGEIIFE